MIVPVGGETFAESLRMGVEVFHNLKKSSNLVDAILLLVMKEGMLQIFDPMKKPSKLSLQQ